ncbi:S-adenosyl-methyltransferase MraW [Bacteroidetes oral taxon 274 str. F0058]|nr:S-adenosyl-methyltransferase MraW [Bacteroidetes oral taxon 274 str. F0058]
MYHVPVLLEESIECLRIKPDGVYVDCTFGGGGHSRAILARLGNKGKLYGFDQDREAYRNTTDDERFTFVRGNFKYISNFLRYYGEDKVDGILADLGVSSHHFDEAERGFSYRFDGTLDMRMNREASFTAEELINGYDEQALADILYLYGELRNARRIANAIVCRRQTKAIKTIFELTEVLRPFCTKGKEYKELAPIFQAIRIEVNAELDSLKTLLCRSVDLLRSGGRIAVISYHSLEDRLVKNFLKTGNFGGEPQKDFYGNQITPFANVSKAIVSNDREIADNPRARSARLRYAEKI